MADDATTVDAPRGEPVREIGLEVVDGPDKGLRLEPADKVIRIGSAEGNTLRLSDRQVSRFHVDITRSGTRIDVKDLDSTNGTFVGGARFRGATASVESGAVLRVGKNHLRVFDGETRVVPVRNSERLGGMLGTSKAMRDVMDRIETLAQRETPVLFYGESGTGKEVSARTLHAQSPRDGEPFITVDCGAVAANLFESTLFGHERGAFTGASQQHLGAFERAGRGTLFLDEIGELRPEQQTALLGVLERREFVRVGGSRTLPFNGRVVAATNRDLRADVNAGTFRLDLYYRLAIVTVELPPLRQRRDDIPLLLQHFIEEEGDPRPPKEVFGESYASLLKHSWPGNARELRNIVAGALALGTVPELLSATPAPTEAEDGIRYDDLLQLPYKVAKAEVGNRLERLYIEHLLGLSEGNVSRAARLGQMNRTHLIDLMKKHQLR
ncbi:MAG: sigma 54-interacting transcriptional regulator [Myxococcota bacterium]